MYRAVALAFLREQRDPAAADALPPDFQLRLGHDEAGEMRVWIGDEDVSDAIRTAEMGHHASQVSALPWVREQMVALQRQIAQAWEAEGGGLVLDGRDIGTVVFPDAPVKVFMEADVRERARRRVRELEARGHAATVEETEAALAQRDHQDASRTVAPLRAAPDAVRLDTTHLSPEDQVDFVVRLVQERA